MCVFPSCLLLKVIPLGLEPKTHALEGRCSNPTELRNRTFLRCKITLKNLNGKALCVFSVVWR